jgi:hypothetical protein
MYYLKHKLLDPSSVSGLLFLWSRLGEFLEILISIILQSDKILRYRELLYLLKSFRYTFKFRKELKSGELVSINTLIQKM